MIVPKVSIMHRLQCNVSNVLTTSLICAYISRCFILILNTHAALVPVIITQPTDTSAAAPFSAVFTCSAKGCGELNIIWHRHNKPLPQRAYSTTAASVNGTTSTLTISNVVNDDVGTYYCVVWASNKAVQSRVASLFIAGKVYLIYD